MAPHDMDIDQQLAVIDGFNITIANQAEIIAELLAALRLAIPAIEYAEIDSAAEGLDTAHAKVVDALNAANAAISKASNCGFRADPKPMEVDSNSGRSNQFLIERWPVG